MPNSHIEAIANAIVSKISSLIGTHNSDSSAHSTLFSAKANSNHNHNIWSLDQNSPSLGIYAFEELEDYDHTSILGSLIHSANDDAVYYNDFSDADFELAVKGDIPDYSWKTATLTNMSGCTLYYNSLFCALKINKSGLTVSSVNTYANIVTGTIPSDYRPAVSVVMRNEGTINVYFKVTDNGNVQMTSDYKPSASFTGKTIIIWARI